MITLIVGSTEPKQGIGDSPQPTVGDHVLQDVSRGSG